MKRLLLTLTLSMAVVASADEPQSLIDAINTTSEARETLMKDLKDADLGLHVRDEYTGCPTRSQYKKILQDEERYNAAAKIWLKESGYDKLPD